MLFLTKNIDKTDFRMFLTAIEDRCLQKIYLYNNYKHNLTSTILWDNFSVYSGLEWLGTPQTTHGSSIVQDNSPTGDSPYL